MLIPVLRVEHLNNSINSNNNKHFSFLRRSILSMWNLSPTFLRLSLSPSSGVLVMSVEFQCYFYTQAVVSPSPDRVDELMYINSACDGARHQDRPTDWQSVVTWPDLREPETASETSDTNSTLTPLIAWENFIVQLPWKLQIVYN
jgi:hypothetical protein